MTAVADGGGGGENGMGSVGPHISRGGGVKRKGRIREASVLAIVCQVSTGCL